MHGMRCPTACRCRCRCCCRTQFSMATAQRHRHVPLEFVCVQVFNLLGADVHGALRHPAPVCAVLAVCPHQPPLRQGAAGGQREGYHSGRRGLLQHPDRESKLPPPLLLLVAAGVTCTALRTRFNRSPAAHPHATPRLVLCARRSARSPKRGLCRPAMSRHSSEPSNSACALRRWRPLSSRCTPLWPQVRQGLLACMGGMDARATQP